MLTDDASPFLRELILAMTGMLLLLLLWLSPPLCRKTRRPQAVKKEGDRERKQRGETGEKKTSRTCHCPFWEILLLRGAHLVA